MGTTQWAPAVGVLAAGLVAGGIAILSLRGSRRAKAEAAAPTSADDVELRARRDQLLDQLKELAVAAAGRPAAEVAAEKARLELALAKVLRDLDHRKSGKKGKGAKATEPAKPPETQEKPAATSSANWGWAAILGGLVAFGVLLGLMLQDEARPRADGMGGMGGGAPMTGGSGGAQEEEEAPPDPELEALARAAEANPKDVGPRLVLAKALLDRGGLFEAYTVAKDVLALDPENGLALAYQSAVRIAMGQMQAALDLTDKAVAKAPKVAETWARRAQALAALGRHTDAAESWLKAAALDPATEAAFKAEAEAAKGREPGMPWVPSPERRAAPAAAAPMQAPMARAPAAAPQGPAIHVSVSLDPAAASGVSPSSIVFVIVRPDGVTAGPPSAARRLRVSDLPVDFALDARDSMTGVPLPEKASVEARVDVDGNPTTKDPNDPTARVTGVVPDGPVATLVLRRGGT